MACVLTTDIAIPCRRSKGGIKKIYVTELANTATQTIASGEVTVFTLASGKQFFEYDLREGSSTADATIGGERAVGSRFYTHRVQIQLSQLDVTLRNEMLLLAQNIVQVIVLDQNGNYWLYGGVTGLEISEGLGQHGTASADLNGFNLTLTGDELDLPYAVDSTLIATLTEPA